MAAGADHQIQVRHILVETKEVADLLKETIEAAPSEAGRVKTLMRLAAKYSTCHTKNDGGNLGWVEVVWDPTESRQPRGGYKALEYLELHDAILKAIFNLIWRSLPTSSRPNGFSSRRAHLKILIYYEVGNAHRKYYRDKWFTCVEPVFGFLPPVSHHYSLLRE
jgi:hypothetical protein